jgi:hypothetical protein
VVRGVAVANGSAKYASNASISRLELQMENEILLQFELSADDIKTANLLAGSLNKALKESTRDIEVSRMREPGADTLDPGTIIIAILATKAAVEVAKGLRDWLSKNQNATITVKKGGDIIVTGAKSGDVIGLMDRILPSTK